MPSATGIAQDAIGFGRPLYFDQAHAAIAGDRQSLVIAEMRDLDPGMFAGLQDRGARRHFDLAAVDGQLRHLRQPLCAGRRLRGIR